MSKDVKVVTVIPRNPSGNPRDLGAVTRGFYILEGTNLTLTTSSSDPVRRSTGDMVTHELKGGEDSELWVRILTKQFRQHIHGDRKPGFSGPIIFPRTP